MTAVNHIQFSSAFWPSNSSPSFSNHPVDANNDGIALTIQAETADAITHIGFRVGARTGTDASLTYAVTLEGIDGSGNPNGTDVGGGSPTLTTFVPPASNAWDGTWQWIALTNSYTPTRGQFLAATVRYSSGTISAGNLISLSSHITNAPGSSYGFPAALRLTGGTWAKQGNIPCMALRTASSRYGFPIENIYSTRSASTVGHRQALKFRLPDVLDSFKIAGMQLVASFSSAAAKAPIAGLWNASGVLQNVTLDTEYVIAPTTTWYQSRIYFDETTLSTLSAATDYYLGLEVADAVSGGVAIGGWQLDSSSDLAAFPGGSDYHLATWNGSAWTDDQTVRPFVDPIFDDMTKPTGGGGLLLPVVRPI